MLKRFAHLTVLVAALGAAGCTDPLSPADLAGTYVAVRYAGEPLPYLTTGPADEPFRFLADTVVLNADGTGRWVIVTQSRAEPPVVVSETAVWRREGFTVRLDRVCPGTAPCLLYAMHREFTIMNGELRSPDWPAEFARVSAE